MYQILVPVLVFWNEDLVFDTVLFQLLCDSLGCILSGFIAVQAQVHLFEPGFVLQHLPEDLSVDTLKVQNVTLLVQFPDLWTVHLGQQELSLDPVQDVPQQDMLLPTEVGIVQILAVQLGRICIEEGIHPVIVWDQHLEALAFNHNLLDSGRHLFQLIKQCFNVERLAGKTLPGTGVAISDKHKICRSLTDLGILCPSSHNLLHGIR